MPAVALLDSIQSLITSYPKSYAVAGCLFCTGSFVGLVLVWRGLPRNHPVSIKRRMLSVVAASSIAWTPLSLAMPKGNGKLMETLGLTTSGLPASAARAMLVTSVFFAGPLLLRLSDPATQRDMRAAMAAAGRVLSATLCLNLTELRRAVARICGDSNLVSIRNLVVAPMAEEFVFRACMVPLLLHQGVGRTTTIFASPLFFGLAHLIHLYEMVHHHRVNLRGALPMVMFQFTYTTVFGWYAAAVFLSTGSVVPPILVHSFCNWMGVPDANAMVRQAGGSVVLPLMLTAGGVVAAVAMYGPMLGQARV